MSKSNILIYSYNFYPFENAISNAMMPVFEALKKDYNVYIYSINQNQKHKCPSYEMHDDFIIYRDTDKKYIKACRKMKLLRMLSDIGQYDENIKGVNIFASIFKKPVILILRRFNAKILQKLHYLENTVITPFETLLRSNSFCAVIAVLTPFCVSNEIIKFARNGYFKKNNIKCISYFVDPYSTFIEHLKSDKFEEMHAQEVEIYNYSDLIFTTPELYEDNKKYILSEYLSKTVPVQLATFKKRNRSNSISIFSQNNLNCVFCGSLFSVAIRNPEYFFNIISKLPKSFIIHIVCYQSCVEVNALRQKYLKDLSNVIWYNRLPIQKCFDMLNDADILINLGNECDNQTPSKVFDYLGCAKPIINFYSIDNDTSKKYLERYPFKLNIKNKTDIDKDDRKAFIGFCENNKQSNISFDYVNELYSEFSGDAIGNYVGDVINEMCSDV